MNYLATIHHLGFYFPSDQENYGKTVLFFDSSDCAALYGEKEIKEEDLAEVVFDLCGNPNKVPKIAMKTKGSYTLSVGDVVEIEDNKQNKKIWLCQGCGWFELKGPAEINHLATKVENAAELGKRWEVGYKGKDSIMARRARTAKWE